MTAPKAPAGLAAAGRRLWSNVVEEFELAEHELALLRQACQTVDAIDRLQKSLAGDEILDSSPQGRRVHPALPELRQQRIVLARLIAQLGVPLGDEEAGEGDGRNRVTKQRRATRGTYKLKAVE